MGFFGMDIDRALDQAQQLEALRSEVVAIRSSLAAITSSPAGNAPELLTYYKEASERDRSLDDFAAFLDGWSRMLRGTANQMRMMSSW